MSKPTPLGSHDGTSAQADSVSDQHITHTIVHIEDRDHHRCEVLQRAYQRRRCCFQACEFINGDYQPYVVAVANVTVKAMIINSGHVTFKLVYRLPTPSCQPALLDPHRLVHVPTRPVQQELHHQCNLSSLVSCSAAVHAQP